MEILKVTDPAFKSYGRVVDNIDFSALVEALKRTPVPEDKPLMPVWNASTTC